MIRRRSLPGLAALLVGLIASSTAPALAQSRLEKEPFQPLQGKTIRGDALVLSREDDLVVAIDEMDGKGGLDGRVDRILYMQIFDLRGHQLSYRDAAAEIEVRRSSLRILLPTLGQDFRFRLMKSNEAMPEALHLGTSLEYRTFKLGTQIYQYSGEEVQELTFAEIERSGAQALAALGADGGVLGNASASAEIAPLRPPTDAETGGGGCQATCSITCGKGSCAAACLPGYCANCKCLNEPPATSASCYCLF